MTIPGDNVDLVLRSERAEIDRAIENLLGVLERLNYPDAARFAVRLAIEEGLANAFNHGHKALPKDTPVRLEFKATPAQVHISIEDQGPGFKPAAVPDPTLDENLEIPTGRGLLLMRSYMSKVDYNDRGNRVSMVYRNPALGSGSAD
ncbi:MAG: ATP-binding protein [Phycisphaeraceae bacterium]|nr:ATP-binding protein [Phycisphaeraceae bacterium]